MIKKLRIVMAQLNFHVGNINDNLKKHIQAANRARDELKADIIVFPELGLTGYPPEDLLLRKTFLDEVDLALKTFLTEVTGIYCIVGYPHRTSEGLENACSLIHNGAVLVRYAKQHLPNYGVFDECRYFIPGNQTDIFSINGIPIAMLICEDLWHEDSLNQAAAKGARLILSPNASPFELTKHEIRMDVLANQIKHHRLPVIYTNSVGGQDELIFDGGSMVLNQDGELCEFAGFFNEILYPVDISISNSDIMIEKKSVNLPTQTEKIYQALVLGVRDYIEKNNFPGILIGLSGGIDSALTLAIATDALGANRVRALLMPSRFTAEMSNEDAITLAKNLNVAYESISIEPAYQAFLDTLAPCFAGKKSDVTEENIQARCRAIILMALSNKYGYLVLTTGNRSELAVGYCTLYGDMAGGFATIKDVPKTMVYELARYRNHIQAIIPERIIDRPPSAELALNQKDEDSLPPYPVLDKILDLYINQMQDAETIIQQGHNRTVVERIIYLIKKNEYKRHQAPIGTRINHTAFGRDRRYPVTNGFKG